MRTSCLSLLGALALATVSGCTKGVDVPALAGPSTFAVSITMTADKDILTQNGLDEAAITVQALGPNGEAKNVNLRAQILVDNVPQDYGTLSTKQLTTPTVIRYRAPAAATTVGGQLAQTVTIAVLPVGSDFNGELSRSIEILLVPQGIILPTNPQLRPDFSFTPTTPLAFNPVGFDASATTNGTALARCNDACTYAWNFGDGTSGTGVTTTHTFRTVGTFQVALTVTDNRGSQATIIKPVTVGASPPPTAAFTTTPPSGNIGVNTDVFFNGSGSFGDRPNGRTIVRYDWNFADGGTASGATVTHRFSAPGTYNVVLTVTDDVGVTDEQSTPITVVSGNPVATMTVTPTPARVGQSTTFNASGSTSTAGSTIVSYTFNWGDGSPAEVSAVPVQSHVYGSTGVVSAVLTVTDSAGRTGTFIASVTITP